MKKKVICIVLILSQNTSNAQIYERTGKNLGLYFSVQPIASFQEKTQALNTTAFTAGTGIVHMLAPGLYPSLGYTFTAFEQAQVFGRMNEISLQHSHTLDAGFLVDKQIAKLYNGRIRSMCHYFSLGFILGPEYHYMLGNREMKNESFGEIGGQIGLSIYHHSSTMNKRSKGKTRQYDVFYRKGFTPVFATSISGVKQEFYRQEIGIRVRLIRHQVYNFLK